MLTANLLLFFLLCRLKPYFPKQGSLKGCFRNVKAQSSHIDLKRMRSSGVSFGCDSDLLVMYLEPRCSVDTCWSDRVTKDLLNQWLCWIGVYDSTFPPDVVL